MNKETIKTYIIPKIEKLIKKKNSIKDFFLNINIKIFKNLILMLQLKTARNLLKNLKMQLKNIKLF